MLRLGCKESILGVSGEESMSGSSVRGEEGREESW